jgi:acyl carrier protein
VIQAGDKGRGKDMMSNSYEDVERQVRGYLETRASGIAGADTERDNLLNTGFLDSLGVLEIVDFLEETFGIVVDEDDFDLGNFQSISKIATFAHAKCNARGS